MEFVDHILVGTTVYNKKKQRQFRENPNTTVNTTVTQQQYNNATKHIHDFDQWLLQDKHKKDQPKLTVVRYGHVVDSWCS